MGVAEFLGLRKKKRAEEKEQHEQEQSEQKDTIRNEDTNAELPAKSETTEDQERLQVSRDTEPERRVEQRKHQKTLAETRKKTATTRTKAINPLAKATKEDFGKTVKETKARTNIKKIEEKIQKEERNETIVPKGDILNKYHKVYRDLFVTKIQAEGGLADDMLQVLIENRKKLRHRFVAEARIYGEQGHVGTITGVGILAEEMEKISSFVRKGEQWDYGQQQLKEFEKFLREHYKSYGTKIQIVDTRKTRISKIEIRMSFA